MITARKLTGAELILLSLALAVPLVAGGYFWDQAVDTPYSDQWSFARLLEKSGQGVLGWHDWIAQHNESRPVVPRLVFFTLAKLSHWNVRVELASIYLMIVLVSLTLFLLSRSSIARLESYWCLFIVNLLLFSPVHFKVYLWGIMLVSAVPLLIFTSTVFLCGLIGNNNIRNSAALLAAFCMTFSSGHGFAAWIVFPIVLAMQSGTNPLHPKRLSPWLAGALVSWWLYFKVLPYRHPGGHPELAPLWGSTQSADQYIWALFGNSFHRAFAENTTTASELIGILIAALSLACVVFVWRNRDDRLFLREARGPVGLILFGWGTVAMAAVGRAGFGPDQALTDRYSLYSVLVPVALVYLVPTIFAYRKVKWSLPLARAYRDVSIVLATGTVMLILLAGNGVWATVGEGQALKREMKAVTYFSQIMPDDDQLRRIYYDPEQLRERIGNLSRFGFMDVCGSTTLPAQRVVGPEALGEWESFQVSDSGLATSKGWAVLPGRSEPAHAVVFTLQSPGHAEQMFDYVTPNLEREALIAEQGLAVPARIGWIRRHDLGTLPAQRVQIRAYAFDAERKEFFPLHAKADIFFARPDSAAPNP